MPPVPVPTTFPVNRNALAAPRYLNWSLGLEKKLPAAIFLKLEFLEKRGVHGFAYNTLNGAVNGNYFLENGRDDRYDSLQVSLRHRFPPALRNLGRLQPLPIDHKPGLRFQFGLPAVN